MTFTIPIWLAWLLGIILGVPLGPFIVLALWICVAFLFAPGRGGGSWWR